MWLLYPWLNHTVLHPDKLHHIIRHSSERFLLWTIFKSLSEAMGSNKALASETRKVKLAALLIAVLTFLVQLHTIAGRGSPQCMAGFPCPAGVCCSAQGTCGVTAADCGVGCQSGPCTGSRAMDQFGLASEQSMGENKIESTSEQSAERLVSAELFDKVFPNRDDFYSFNAFVAATKAFPEFGTTGSEVCKKRDIAAFFAHVHHETAGLTKISDGPTDGAQDSIDFCCTGSCLELNPFAKSYSCAPGKKYFARGPMKLTWNYNYGSASRALGADLLAEPELVTKDAIVSFKSALWVWMNSDNDMPSGHDVMVGPWSPSASDIAANRLPGFGASIDILEGHAECGHESPEAVARTQDYLHIAKIIDVSPGAHLACATMLPFN